MPDRLRDTQKPASGETDAPAVPRPTGAQRVLDPTESIAAVRNENSYAPRAKAAIPIAQANNAAIMATLRICVCIMSSLVIISPSRLMTRGTKHRRPFRRKQPRE
ncbi:protein of unknown function [Hyphomicrobium sp. 1Nfss2.1]